MPRPPLEPPAVVAVGKLAVDPAKGAVVFGRPVEGDDEDANDIDKANKLASKRSELTKKLAGLEKQRTLLLAEFLAKNGGNSK